MGFINLDLKNFRKALVSLFLFTSIAQGHAPEKIWNDELFDHFEKNHYSYSSEEVFKDTELKQEIKNIAQDSRLLEFLILEVEKMLPKASKAKAWEVSNTLLQTSQKYSFDPLFVVAVIQNESSFNPRAIGKYGEIGLMQIKPTTAKWVAKKYSLPWIGKKSLFDMTTNIRIGVAYLSFLRNKFMFHGDLYLIAYNMGSTNVRKALNKQVLNKIYYVRVMKRYLRIYNSLSKYTKNATVVAEASPNSLIQLMSF